MVHRGMVAKRVFDLTLATAAFVLLSPLLLAIAIAIRWTSGPPVLFRQVRPGFHGRPFTMLKFRTMATTGDARGRPLPDEKRVTRLGRFLRATSLDELPEIINVVKGDMSLVGPRPLLMEYLDRYTPEQMRRHEVKPGITGWTQVNGRNALTWDEKFAYDLWYVNHHSLLLDSRILLRTAWKVLKREGIHFPVPVSEAEFMGTGSEER